MRVREEKEKSGSSSRVPRGRVEPEPTMSSEGGLGRGRCSELTKGSDTTFTVEDLKT